MQPGQAGDAALDSPVGTDGSPDMRRVSVPVAGEGRNVGMSFGSSGSCRPPPANGRLCLPGDASASFSRPAPLLAHPDNWPHYPVNCRCTPGLPIRIECDPQVVPLNPRSPIHFETPLFIGKMYLAVRDCPGSATDPWGPRERFEPKRRKIVLTVQGRFKERLRMDTVQTGWVFSEQLRNLPWGISKAEALIRALGGPGSSSDLCNKKSPYLLNLLCCGADSLHVWDPRTDRPEHQHDITGTICPERSHWKDVKDRQKKLGGGAAANHFFEVGPTYTFDFYGDKVDLVDFAAKIPLLGKFGLANYLGPQPLPFLAKTTTGDYLWCFEVWHAEGAEMLPPGAIRPPRIPEDVEGGLVAARTESWPGSFLSWASTRDSGQRPFGSLHFASCRGGSMAARSAPGAEEDDESSQPPLHSKLAAAASSFAERRPFQGARDRARRLRSAPREALKDRWEAWEVTGFDGLNPRPGDALCAFIASTAFVAVVALAVVWWRDLIADRISDAVTHDTSVNDWLFAGAVLLGVAIFLIPMGHVTDWWRRRDKGREGWWLLGCCTVATLWGLTEEIVFRVALLPRASEKVDERSMTMWIALSITTFVTHYGLVAATCVRVGYPTFFDPRFQAIAAIVGGAAAAVYRHTQSLWPTVAVHVICVNSWLVFGGGARRLRKVRFHEETGKRQRAAVSGMILPPAPVLRTPVPAPTEPPPSPAGGAHPARQLLLDIPECRTATSVYGKSAKSADEEILASRSYDTIPAAQETAPLLPGGSQLAAPALPSSALRTAE